MLRYIHGIKRFDQKFLSSKVGEDETQLTVNLIAVSAFFNKPFQYFWTEVMNFL